MQTVVCLMEKTMPVEVNTHPTIISRRLNINSSAAASHIQQTAQPIETAHELKARTVLWKITIKESCHPLTLESV